MAALEASNKPEFNEKRVFHNHLDNLFRLEESWNIQSITQSQKLLELEKTKQYFFGDPHYGNVIKDSERLLFTGIFNIFSFKHKITKQDRDITQLGQEKKKGKVIGFLGPIGVGKSTLAEAVANKMSISLVNSEPHLENPFWQAQQDNSKKYDDFMLRSQIFFLLFNIQAGIKADIFSRIRKDIFISDTSIFNDIFEFVEWYTEIDRFDKEEHKSYLRLIELFKPIIPKPDLLVVVNAETPQQLLTGIQKRKKDNLSRKGETSFTKNNLKIQMDLTSRVLDILISEWDIKTFYLTVDPLKFNKINLDKSYLNQIVSQIFKYMYFPNALI